MSEPNVPKSAELSIPLLPLRDVVVYPHMVIPLFVGRDKSILALEAAVKGNKKIILASQIEATKDKPEATDIYRVGTIATILQLLKLPDNSVKVLVEGVQRGKINSYLSTEPYFLVEAQPFASELGVEQEIAAILRSLVSQFEQYVELNKKIPPEVVTSLAAIDDPVRLVDTIAAHMQLKLAEKQNILEQVAVQARIEHLMKLMEAEIDVMQAEKRIRSNVKKQLEKTHREYYLTEQMKAIQKELGVGAESGKEELVMLKEKIEQAGMSTEARDKALVEFNKLSKMSPMSAEATVVRNYIDYMLAVPWQQQSKTRINLEHAEKILNAEHYGLDKVKERILEYLAVQKRVGKIRGPILCIVGPPGVGKTSLGKSIARATNREFVRMALGGVRDEAEIRGHRKTYIGAMPGKIIQKLIKAKVKNPVFLLDEVDKIAMDYRGDPAAALLEVLDPEQNNSFNDHYLEVDYDLSNVMFIATANSLNIPLPLLDRMEVIRIAGYTEDEKLNIAKKYLITRQIATAGLKAKELSLTDEAILNIIRYYTKEAGVRNLDREISKLCRKVVRELLTDKKLKHETIDADVLEKYLGVYKYRFGQMYAEDRIGHVTGLAWTEVGGELLTIEVAYVTGKGKVTCTGKLGEVMQESIQAAITVIRSRAHNLGLNEDFYEKHDYHIHLPEGAIPKDGPSAGISVCTALASTLTGVPVRRDVAMTGEITLRGEVLPIGGLKEKLLAAKRGGIKHVIIPQENARDLAEIPDVIYAGIEIHPVRWIDEVFQLALIRIPQPLAATKVDVVDLNADLTTQKQAKKINPGRADPLVKPGGPDVPRH